MSDAIPHVYAAIGAVMADISKEGIAKDKRNDQQKYTFRGIDDVYNALAPILSRNKLVIIPRVLSREKSERTSIKDDGRGNVRESTLFYVVLHVEFDLISAVDGSKHVAVTWGEAMDSGDKATNKAMSAAYKYMAMQTFCIPTEGDNDADAATHHVSQPKQAPARQPEREARLEEDDHDRKTADDLIRLIQSSKSEADVTAAAQGAVSFMHALKQRNPKLFNKVQDEAAKKRAALKAEAAFNAPNGHANGHEHGGRA